jgi:hypothetical protein
MGAVRTLAQGRCDMIGGGAVRPQNDVRPSEDIHPAVAAMRLLLHPVVVLVASLVSAVSALRALFLWQAEWLWHFARVVAYADVTPWARFAMRDRDGAEPYALIAYVFLLSAVAIGGSVGLSLLLPRPRSVAVASLLGMSAVFAHEVPPRPPLAAVAPLGAATLVVAGCWLSTLLLQRSTRCRAGALVGLAVVLAPICFLPTTHPSLQDLFSILSPALRLQHGSSVREVYLQYDLLPSLLAIGWSQLGGQPLGFACVCAAAYYAMLLGLFVLARRMFRRASLVAPLLVAVVVVRIYACIIDPTAMPQVTPVRLELWLFLLAAVLRCGLEHWCVGFVLGLLCLLSRSMGTLYLGAYGLALLLDFLARRWAAPPAARPAWIADVRRSAHRLAAPALCIVAFLAAARWLFGGFGSDALALYREFGVGMLRIAPHSFYWWLLPLTPAVGWLAFAQRGSLPERHGQAAILVAPLVLVNSFYFFGRSHEANLINLAASFLFCCFLGLDLAWPSSPHEPRPMIWAFRAAPWLIVGACGYYYSGRILERMAAQVALFLNQRPLPMALQDFMPVIHCDEIRRAAGDARLFFLSKADFFYYHDCGLEPQGYIQPVSLNVFKRPLIEEMNRLLTADVEIVIPRDPRDWDRFFSQFRGDLVSLAVVETPNYRVYRRQVATANTSPP